jgi:hypothetical protein
LRGRGEIKEKLKEVSAVQVRVVNISKSPLIEPSDVHLSATPFPASPFISLFFPLKSFEEAVGGIAEGVE